MRTYTWAVFIFLLLQLPVLCVMVPELATDVAEETPEVVVATASVSGSISFRDAITDLSNRVDDIELRLGEIKRLAVGNPTQDDYDEISLFSIDLALVDPLVSDLAARVQTRGLAEQAQAVRVLSERLRAANDSYSQEINRLEQDAVKKTVEQRGRKVAREAAVGPLPLASDMGADDHEGMGVYAKPIIVGRDQTLTLEGLVTQVADETPLAESLAITGGVALAGVAGLGLLNLLDQKISARAAKKEREDAESSLTKAKIALDLAIKAKENAPGSTAAEARVVVARQDLEEATQRAAKARLVDRGVKKVMAPLRSTEGQLVREIATLKDDKTAAQQVADARESLAKVRMVIKAAEAFQGKPAELAKLVEEEKQKAAVTVAYVPLRARAAEQPKELKKLAPSDVEAEEPGEGDKRLKAIAEQEKQQRETAAADEEPGAPRVAKPALAEDSKLKGAYVLATVTEQKKVRAKTTDDVPDAERTELAIKRSLTFEDVSIAKPVKASRKSSK